jgi:ankyrin repeat protein
LKALESLPRTPDELYNAALERIERQSREDATLALRTFAWVYHSREHTSISLLQVALAIEPGDNIINEDGYVDWEALTSICGGLIVMDRESQIVRFVHPTTRTYFEQYFDRQPHSLESNITVSCLTFILSDTFKDLMADLTQLPSQSLDERDTRRFDNYQLPAFLIYAARNVTAHYCSHGDTQECSDLMKRVFNSSETLTLFWWARVQFSVSACGWKLPKVSDSDKLCIASFLGLSTIVEWLLESDISPNDLDTTGQTPLYAAASRSENRVVEILLRQGADPDQASFDTPQSLGIDSNAQPLCYTPMHCALVCGNIELVRTLERHGVIMGPSRYASQSITPLRMVIQSKSKPTIEYVLQKHQQDLQHDKLTVYSPLHDAIEGGSLEVLSMLLEAGASGSALDDRRRLPIEAAILAPSWRVSDATCNLMCKMLIKHEPSMQSFLESDKFQLYRPVLWAQRPQTLGMLLERHWRNGYNNPDSPLGGLWQCLNDNSSNAATNYISELDFKTIAATELENSNVLFYAIYRGWELTVVAILTLADTLHCDISLKSRALCEAIQGYHFTIVNILLDAGADINAVLPTGTPLCRAVLSQSSRLVEHLLSRGANPSTGCIRYTSAMHALVDGQFISRTHYITKILRLLFQHGADVNMISSLDGTILTAMANMSSRQSLEGIRYLLSLGADCNKTGGHPFTPMIAAARSRNHYSLEVMQVLHRAGADVNAFGGHHGTALLAALKPNSFCGAEKILKLVEWGADIHAAETYSKFISMAAVHGDLVIRNLALDNHLLLQKLSNGNVPRRSRSHPRFFKDILRRRTV